MSKPLLAYWDIRGRAQPIRHMLVYAGIDFEDKLYVIGPKPCAAKQWREEKFNLGLDFPNLPYYIDGDLKITESLAIFQHLARKYDLYGRTEKDRVNIDTLNGVFEEFHGDFVTMIHENWDGKDNFLKLIPQMFKALSDFLGAKKWLIGEEISYIDFRYYELLRTFSKFSAGCLDGFDNLKNFVSRFEELPAIAEYMQNPNYIHKPIYAPMANFTGND